ncbi:MAG: ComEC/Rec2 family competence protein [Pseudomonadota bacterium]
MVLLQRASLDRVTAAVRWPGSLDRLIEAERDRWLLWLPVAFGGGIALYFLLKQEPPWWVSLPPLAAALTALIWLRQQLVPVYLLTLLAAFSAGLGAAQIRSELVAGPLLTERIGPTQVTGRLIQVERRVADSRLLIAPTAIGGLTADELPRRLRLRLAGKRELALSPGDQISLRATLLPPPPPALPGGYDFGRDAFFRGIGAVGFILGPVERLDVPAAGGWRLFWEGLRDDLGQEIRQALPPAEAGIAEALLTGQRAAIDPELQEAYRASGLAHLLAISGLHVGLIAGLFFLGLRALLALFPPIALRWPIKKIAALVTALVLPFYLPMVGASVPTQRACLMALVVLAAILLDRRAISLRLVAWAALVVLAWSPEVLLGASFQLSFAAVTALVAVYESWRANRQGWERDERWERRLLLYFLGVVTTSLIAGLATAPFAAYHFHRLATYGLLANLIAVPLTAFWIMPWCLLVYLLLPFGLQGLAFEPLSWGLSILNGVALEVAELPGALVHLPAMPLWGLAAIALGGLWLCLWRTRWRLLGLAVLLAGCLSGLTYRAPDILITADQRLIALAGPDEQLWLSTRRVGRFSADLWLRRRAQASADTWAEAEAGGETWLRCDSLGCRYRHDGGLAALALRPEALREDCTGVDLLIARSPVPRDCLRSGQVLDRFDFWRNGGHAVWLSVGEVRIDSVAQARGNRPWSPARRSSRRVFLPGETQ